MWGLFHHLCLIGFYSVLHHFQYALYILMLANDFKLSLFPCWDKMISSDHNEIAIIGTANDMDVFHKVETDVLIKHISNACMSWNILEIKRVSM